MQLTDMYPPFIGGLERHVQILGQQFAALGHTSAVLTSALPTAPASVTEEDGVTVHRVTGWQHKLLNRFYQDGGRPFHPTIPDPGMVRSFHDAVTDFRPDVIHAHSWNLYSMLPLINKLNLPVLHLSHDYGLLCAKKTLTLPNGNSCAGPELKSCLSCASQNYGTAKGTALTLGLRASDRLLGRVDRFAAVSQYVADQLAPTITPLTGKPVHVLNSFVPAGLHDSGWAADKPDFVPDGDFILFVGALSGHKGLRVLLDAHSKLQRRVPLVLLGTPAADTPSADELAADVTLRTNVPHAQVIAAMVRASVSVAPSLWPDPLPMTVSEAQLCGTPVIGTTVGGIPEQILDGSTGLLVEPGDATSLAAALDNLLADPQRRSEMGAHGMEWARKFEAQSMARSIVSTLAEVVAEHHGAAATASARVDA